MPVTPNQVIERMHAIATQMNELGYELWQCPQYTAADIAKLNEAYARIEEYAAGLKWSISVQLPKD
jgi:hypothetical protein